MSLTNARELALRALHRGRERETAEKLSTALNRMQAGEPRNLSRSFKWTKANLARESGVHVTTILFRLQGGGYRYAAAIARFEQLRGHARQIDAKPDDRREPVEELEQELAAQAEMICQMRAKISDLESRNALLGDLHKRNAELRTSFLEMQSRCQEMTELLAGRRGATDGP